MREKFIAGNWKMFTTVSEAKEYAKIFKMVYKPKENFRVAFAVPFTQITTAKEAFEGLNVGIGAQNLHTEDEGAYTGEISAKMLKDAGAEYVIVGHSERRQYFKEINEVVNAKLRKALLWGLKPILCVGETLEQREGGLEREIVIAQTLAGLADVQPEMMANVTIAYEPIWAIGTGKTATAAEAQEMCKLIRTSVEEMFGEEIAEKTIVQYGGSVKPNNAKEILEMPDIDGALVGGASLDPVSFNNIINYQ